MVILLLLLAVAGLATAVIAYRADNEEDGPLKAKVSIRPQMMSAPPAPTAANEAKKNPLTMLSQIFKKKPEAAPLTESSAVPKKNPLSMLTNILKKKI